MIQPMMGVRYFRFVRGKRKGRYYKIDRKDNVRCLYWNPEFFLEIMGTGQAKLEDQQHERKGQRKGMGKIKS